jgi:hypothetical protein
VRDAKDTSMSFVLGITGVQVKVRRFMHSME